MALLSKVWLKWPNFDWFNKSLVETTNICFLLVGYQSNFLLSQLNFIGSFNENWSGQQTILKGPKFYWDKNKFLLYGKQSNVFLPHFILVVPTKFWLNLSKLGWDKQNVCRCTNKIFVGRESTKYFVVPT